MKRAAQVAALVLPATCAGSLAAQTPSECWMHIRPGPSASLRGPVLVMADRAQVVNIMRSGIRVSWRASETPIPHGIKDPVFDGCSHGDSGWGGYPPADNERAWRQIYRHADRLGLD